MTIVRTKKENKKYFSHQDYRRYHYKVFFPKDELFHMIIEFFENINEIVLSNHSIDEMDSDKFGVIPTPSKNDLMNPDNILVEYYEPVVNGEPQGFIQKMLLRVKHLSEKYDYTYIVAKEGEIISAWGNKKNDIHRLTNKNNYYSPPTEMAA